MINKLHLVVKTRESRNAGTQNHPVLIMGDQNRDLVHHSFDTGEAGLPAGEAAYFTLPVEGRNLPNYFNQIRLGLRGADLWQLDFAFLWADTTPEAYEQFSVQPLAFAPLSLPSLSVDEQEGVTSTPLPLCYLGGFYTEIQQLLVVIRNSEKKRAGTKSFVYLSVMTTQGLACDVALNPEGEFGYGETLIALPKLQHHFFYNQLRSVELRIEGDDQWEPGQVSIFGISNIGETRQMVPMVYIPHWAGAGLPKMSSDPKEGEALVQLYRAYL
jgi:hypothetical protein